MKEKTIISPLVFKMTTNDLKKKYEQPTVEIIEPDKSGVSNRYSLPYGLCQSVGINTQGMTPREAWDAWQSKTGKTKQQAEKEHWGKEQADDKKEKEEIEQSTEEVIKKMLESDRIKETKTLKKERIKSVLSYGKEEMRKTTARLFNDDSFIYENRRDEGTYFIAAGNRVQYKMPTDGGSGSAYSEGSAFYHETWHAIDWNYGDKDYLSKTYILSNGKTMQEVVFRETRAVDWAKVKEEIAGDKDRFLKDAGYTIERAEEIKNKYKAKIKEWHNLPVPHPRYDEWIEATDEHKEALKYSEIEGEVENRLKRKWGDLSDIYSGYSRSNYGLVGLAHKVSYWNISNRAIEAFAECASAKATNPESYAVLKKYVPNVVEGFEEIYKALNSGRLKANVRI